MEQFHQQKALSRAHETDDSHMEVCEMLAILNCVVRSEGPWQHQHNVQKRISSLQE